MERATGEANNIAHPRVVSPAATRFYTVGCGWFLWNAIPLPCILRLMSQAPTTLGPDSNLKWYQGLDRYCWVVLIIAALGWLFDTMDQNLFTMVRAPSLSDMFKAQFTAPDGTVNRPALAAAVAHHAGLITTIFILGWATGGF